MLPTFLENSFIYHFFVGELLDMLLETDENGNWGIRWYGLVRIEVCKALPGQASNHGPRHPKSDAWEPCLD
jgi:hypothetical protein